MLKISKFFCWFSLLTIFPFFSAFSLSLKDKNVKNPPIELKKMLADPFAQFSQWSKQIKSDEKAFFVLGTANSVGIPSTRLMTLKSYDDKGFVFYSSSVSFKAQEMKSSPFASMTFYWPEAQQQVNIKGKIELLTKEESAAYFKTRSKESQLGSLASVQGKEINSKNEVTDKFKKLQKEYAKKDVPMPDHWQGYRIVPQTVEFWQAGHHTLHDRVLYVLEKNKWMIKILSP